MKRFCFLAFILFIISMLYSSVPSPKTHIYYTEYTKAVASVHCLNVIFFIKSTPQQAEEILRAEMQFIIKNLKPKFDVLGTAWYSPTGDEVDEEMIILSNGKKHLVYSIKTKSINYL